MKQLNDTKTLDLLAEEKRGRGRPRSENPKSPADRARLYRLNKKTRPQVVSGDAGELVLRVAELGRQLLGAEAVIRGMQQDRARADLRIHELAVQLGAAEQHIKSDSSRKRVTKKSAAVKSVASQK